MAIPIPSIRTQRIRDAIGQWVEDTAGIPVIWANQNVPRPPRTYCQLGFPRGRFAPFEDEPEIYRLAPKSLKYTVEGPVAEGKEFILSINGFVYKYIALLGDDENSVRDVLAGLINDSPEPVTASALPGLGEFQVDADFDGSILAGKAVLGLSVETLESVEVWDTRGVREYVVSFDLYAQKPYGLDQLEDIHDVLETSLFEEDTQFFLNQHGLASWGAFSPGSDLSVLEGGRIEARLYFEIKFNTRSLRIRPAKTIGKINMGFEFSDEEQEVFGQVDVQEGP